jgi:hypothetical protein
MMNDPQSNPYRPPVAQVADPPRSDDTPRIVAIALWLLWTGIAVEVIDTAFDVHAGLQTHASVVIATNGTIAMVGVVCWLIFMIGRRRNWARIVYAVLFALGAIVQGLNWQNLLNGSTRDLLSIVSQFGLQLAAMILLFRREADEWFGSRKGPDLAA